MTIDLFQLGVKVLLQDQSGKLLLLKVATDGFTPPIAPYWDIPGGRVERHGSIVETLNRETKEETGIGKVMDLTFLTSVVANIRIPHEHTDVGLLLQIYSGSIDEETSIYLSDEHLAYEWVDPKTAAERLRIKYPIEFVQVVEGMGL